MGSDLKSWLFWLQGCFPQSSSDQLIAPPAFQLLDLEPWSHPQLFPLSHVLIQSIRKSFQLHFPNRSKVRQLVAIFRPPYHLQITIDSQLYQWAPAFPPLLQGTIIKTVLLNTSWIMLPLKYQLDHVTSLLDPLSQWLLTELQGNPKSSQGPITHHLSELCPPSLPPTHSAAATLALSQFLDTLSPATLLPEDTSPGQLLGSIHEALLPYKAFPDQLKTSTPPHPSMTFLLSLLYFPPIVFIFFQYILYFAFVSLSPLAHKLHEESVWFIIMSSIPRPVWQQICKHLLIGCFHT